MNAQLKKISMLIYDLNKIYVSSSVNTVAQQQKHFTNKKYQSNTQIWVSSITLHFKKLEKAKDSGKFCCFPEARIISNVFGLNKLSLSGDNLSIKNTNNYDSNYLE